MTIFRSMTPTAVIVGALIIIVAGATQAGAGTLENLERERAILIENVLDPETVPADRLSKIDLSKRRLVDLERMVLRDKNLVGRNTPAVRRAFENYDLTFLVHGSTENNLSLVDAWLTQVGITTQNLISSRMGRR